MKRRTGAKWREEPHIPGSPMGKNRDLKELRVLEGPGDPEAPDAPDDRVRAWNVRPETPEAGQRGRSG